MPKIEKFEKTSLRLRKKVLDLERKRLLITNLLGSEQEQDLSVPTNCMGFGRIRHFRRANPARALFWPPDPLPMDPVCRALNLPPVDMMRAQVFQIAGCNFKCWYCFVPYDLLQADIAHSKLLTAHDLIGLYLNQPDPPPVIDLSGGQPDIAPEWVPWMMQELRNRQLDDKVYLWSDDNLSSDFFGRFLSESDQELVREYNNYSRVCCFKGYDPVSFSFNTRTHETLFSNQFRIFERLLSFGMDLYAYATFTTPSDHNIQDLMRKFIDSLQELDRNLPLRTVPLEIIDFTPVKSRLNDETRTALKKQYVAVEAWQKQLELRFTSDERALNIADVPLSSRQ